MILAASRTGAGPTPDCGLGAGRLEADSFELRCVCSQLVHRLYLSPLQPSSRQFPKKGLGKLQRRDSLNKVSFIYFQLSACSGAFLPPPLLAPIFETVRDTQV
jgi:hypothetical protein